MENKQIGTIKPILLNLKLSMKLIIVLKILIDVRL